MPKLAAVVCADPQRRSALAQALGAAGTNADGIADVAALLARGRAPQALVIAPADHAQLLAWAAALGADAHLSELPWLAIGAPGGDFGAAEALALGAADFAGWQAADAEIIARLHRRVQSDRLLERASQRNARSALVLELTQALSSTLELREILALVVRRVAEVLAVARVSIVLHGESDTAYVMAASDDLELRDLPIKLSDYPEIARVIETRAPVQIADAQGHPILSLAGAQVPKRFRALTLFPILFEGRAMGALFLRDGRPRALGEDEVFLLSAIANATGIALRNARLLRSARDRERRSSALRQQAEQEKRALQRYAEFFDCCADGILIVAQDGAILFCNPAACAITGRPADALAGMRLDELLPDDGRTRFAELREAFAHGALHSNTDLPILAPGGERRVLNASFNCVLGGEEDLILSLRDVTADRAIARQLMKTKEFLQRVIDSSVDAIVSADMRGNVLLFNPAAERIYGYRAEEVVGHINVAALYPAGAAREIMRKIRELEADGARLSGHETELVGKSGERIPATLSAALIEHRGRPIGSVGIFRDLRKRRQMEAQILAAEQRLAEKEKQALIAELAGATAHELNQPLTAVMGYAALLCKRGGDERMQAACRRILAETERMAAIVKKIGKLTKYETHAYVGDTRIIDLDRSAESEPPSGPAGVL